jgi:GAF domain-containing protein
VTGKIDDECASGAASMLARICEHIAVATGDAVTVRSVSADGTALEPLSAHHGEPRYAEAMTASMRRHQRLDEGLWGAVLARRTPVAWTVPDGSPPAEATRDQAGFIRTYRVRAILAAPIRDGDRAIGGVALVRFVASRPFDDDETRLVVDCCERLAPVVALHRAVARRREAAPPDCLGEADGASTDPPHAHGSIT